MITISDLTFSEKSGKENNIKENIKLYYQEEYKSIIISRLYDYYMIVFLEN